MSHITILLVSLFCEQKLIEQMRESDFSDGKAQYKYQPPVPVDFSNPVSPPSEAESCTLLSLNIAAMFSVYVLYCIVLYCIIVLLHLPRVHKFREILCIFIQMWSDCQYIQLLIILAGTYLKFSESCFI